MVKVFKKFENQENGSVSLMLSSSEHKETKRVEGLDFKNASEDDRKAFLDREKRHIDNYLIKGKTRPLLNQLCFQARQILRSSR